MSDVRPVAARLLLAVQGAAAGDPDERAELARVVALFDAMEHDVLPFGEFDVAMAFLVGHSLVEVEGGQVFSLTSVGYAAAAGTSAAATVDAALSIVAPRLAALDVADGRSGVVDEAAYAAVVRDHVHRPRPSRSSSPRPPQEFLPPPTGGRLAAVEPPSSSSSAPTRLATATKLVGIVAVGTALGVAGVPSAAVVIAASGVGSAVAMADAASRRVSGAQSRVPAAELVDYPVQVPAERVAVGRKFQFRLAPPTSRVWAPGLLCLAHDRVRFVAADDRWADRDWEGPCDRLEILDVGLGDRGGSIVRVHHPDGRPQAQFALPVRLRAAPAPA